MKFHLDKDGLKLISNDIEKSLEETFEPLGIFDWNSTFWVVYAGGCVIFDQIELKLGLKSRKTQGYKTCPKCVET